MYKSSVVMPLSTLTICFKRHVLHYYVKTVLIVSYTNVMQMRLCVHGILIFLITSHVNTVTSNAEAVELLVHVKFLLVIQSKIASIFVLLTRKPRSVINVGSFKTFGFLISKRSIIIIII